MKYIKLIIGGLLTINAFGQLIKFIISYESKPISEWTIGAEIGTIGILIVGVTIFKSGLQHNKERKI